jgi:hypothetical protein
VPVLENSKNSPPITKETVQRKALKVATFLKSLWQDFKTSDGWAVRFMHCKGLARYGRITLAQNVSTDYLEKLIS